MATVTPWGPSQSKVKFTQGINFYTTASHGGFILSPTKNALIPDYARIESGAYEEDSDFAIVVTFFPEFFDDTQRDSASASLKTWHPDIYEKFYHTTLLPGHSYVKDKRDFDRDAEVNNRFIVASAVNDGHENVPSGYVGVTARARRTGFVATFLVPADEYAARSPFGFVIDVDRHEDWKVKVIR